MKRSVLFAFVVAATSVCSGQWLERQVVLGDTLGGISLTGGIVVNPISGNVYIESNPIQIFNPVTMEKLRGPDAMGMVVFCPPSGKGYILGDSAVILDAAADTVIGATPLPFPPTARAYSATSSRLYLGTAEYEELIVFDPDGDSILQTIQIGADILSLLWDSTWNRLYVGTNADSGQLKVFDCAAGTFAEDVQLPLLSIPSLALSPASRKLYCGGQPDTSDGNEVIVVSTDSLTAIGSVPGIRRPRAQAYNPITDRLCCVGRAQDSVFVVDCRADTVRTRFEVLWATCVAVNPLSGRAYVGLMHPAQVLVMDTSESVVDSIALSTAPTEAVMAVTFWPDRNELYGVTSADLAFVIDASADTVAGVVSYAAYTAYKMVHNPAGNKLYLFCTGQDDVLVMDSTFGTPKHIFDGVTNSYAVPVLDQTLNRIYVADGDVLRVIDCNSDVLTQTFDMDGISRPVAVMVPHLNKLYVFAGSGIGDNVYAYDGLRGTVDTVFALSAPVPDAVFDPRSNRVFFACRYAPTVRALDPVTDSVVKTFDLVGGAYRGRMALNLDLGRLYYTDQSPEMMFTIDVLADSVLASESLPWDIDTMFLNRRLGKLYLCSRDVARVLVFDCGQGAIVDTIDVDFHRAGLMNDRNDKLYLRHGAVVDCRYDSVVAMLPDSLNPRSMAWDAIDNRVFQATTSRLYVYRDDLSGVADQPRELQTRRHATIVRGVLSLPWAPGGKLPAPRILLDISGRKVLDLKPGRNDVGALSVGVYFIRQAVGSRTAKVVVQR